MYYILGIVLTRRVLLRKDMSNPLTRPHMMFYPEDAGCEASQMWHGEKWLKTAPDDVLTPMVKHPETGRHYYVGELVRCVDGTLFIPMRWFRRKGAGMWARGHQVIDSLVNFILFYLCFIS